MAESEPISFSSLSVPPPARRAGPLWLGLVAAGLLLYGTVASTQLGGAVGLAVALTVPLGVVAWQRGLRTGLVVATLAVPASLWLGTTAGLGPTAWLLGAHGASLVVTAALGRLRDLDALAAREQVDGLRVRRQVAQRRTQAAALFAALPDTIFRLDGWGQVSVASPVAQPDGLAPRVLEDLVPAFTAEELRRRAARVLETGQPEDLEYEARDGGRPTDYEARLVAGGDGEVIGILRDVTAHKRLQRELIGAREAALDAARLKTKFLANMSHEIRTPMNGVIGMTNLLRETALTREQREYVEIIYKSGNALLEIIDDILDFAKIEAGKMELDTVDFDLRTCTYETVDAVAGQAYAKDLELGTLVDFDVPALVAGDPNRLRQILHNLLTNAVRYTDRGGVSVHVGLAGQRGDAQLLRFRVRDTGRGLDPSVRGELFQPLLLDDAEASGENPRRGPGLGLAICRQLVGLMGGDIGVESEIDGTSFWFTAEMGIVRASGMQEEAAADPRGVRVLLVQSSPRRRLLAEVLRSFGAVPEIASRDETVVRLLAAERERAPFAAVIVDMPRDPETALAAVEAVRAEPGLRELPVLAVDDPEAASTLLREDLRRAVGRLLSWPLRHDEVFGALTAAMGRATEESHRRRTTSAQLPVVTEGLMNGVRVLVAEDNPVNQRVAQRTLQLLGCESEVASDGRQAVRMALDSRFDAVLMDCQMPELDGFEATRRIRQGGVLGGGLPIIAMTASTANEERERCLACGMNDFLCKPVNVPDLRAVLARWVAPPERVSGSYAGHVQPQSELDVPVGEPLEAEILQKLTDIGEGDPGFVREMIELFLDQTPRNLAAMQAALSVSDLDAVAKTAHTLKSSAAYLGAARLGELCKLVETKARASDGPTVDRGVAALHAEYERVQQALQLERQRLAEQG